VNEIRVICKNNLSLTAYSDPKQAKGTFKKMVKDGKQVVFQDGMILERFEDKTKEQIADDIEKDIKKTYQDKINAGGDYTKVSKEYETEFNKQYLDRYDKEVFGSDTLKQKNLLVLH